MYHAHKNTGRPSSDSEWVPMYDIPVEAWQTSLGNSSHYLDEGFTPLFPFGYGLSYTTFSYDNLRISKEKMKVDEVVSIEVDLTNTGKFAGKEVVQLYIQDLFASVTRPVKELKGFQKISLKAGEKRTIRFQVSAEQLNFFNEDINFTTEPGDFKIWIGSHSDTEQYVNLEVVK